MTGNTANIFNIQRFSLHDGPGIRTTVFFKGCNMRCAWCHNPESFKTAPELSFDANKCIGCMKCISLCKSGAHTTVDGRHVFDKSKCIGCFECARQCPSHALSVVGNVRTVDEVFTECMKDKKYYTKGGGVTFSGGEATLYADFIITLAQRLHSENVHIALETNGYLPCDEFSRIIPHIDLFLFDFKLYDDELHKKYTGVSNKRILENLKQLSQRNKPVILRLPIIPTVNDNENHIAAARRLCDEYKNILHAEIMPYHDIGKYKWDNMMLNYTLDEIKPPSAETVAKWNEMLKCE